MLKGSLLFTHGTHREAVGAVELVVRIDERRIEVQIIAVIRRVRTGRPIIAVVVDAGCLACRGEAMARSRIVYHTAEGVVNALTGHLIAIKFPAEIIIGKIGGRSIRRIEP